MAGADLTASFTDGVVHVQGEIDLSSAMALEAALKLADGPLVLDMDGVSFMDSSGVSVLIREHQARSADGGLRIAAMSSSVRRILEVVGLCEVFTGGPDASGVAQGVVEREE